VIKKSNIELLSITKKGFLTSKQKMCFFVEITRVYSKILFFIGNQARAEPSHEFVLDKTHEIMIENKKVLFS
jgi:hypothetical protein